MIARESDKFHITLDRAIPYPQCVTMKGKATTSIAPKTSPRVIVANISLPRATRATMKPMSRNVMRCPRSIPVDAKNIYVLK